MRVLFIHHNESLGGAERSISELVTGLVRNGVDVSVVLPAEGKFAERLRGGGAEVSTVSVPKLKRTLNPMKIALYLKARKELSALARDMVREGGYDIVHFNSLASAVLFGDGLDELAPVVFHLRDSLLPRVIFEAHAKGFRLCIAISSYMKRVLEDFLRVPPNRVVKILNGIAFPKLVTAARRRKARRALDIPEDAFVVVSASAFVPWKNHTSLFDAFRRVKDKMNSPLLVICGSDLTGENTAHARKVTSMAKGLKNMCRLAGQVDDIEPWLHAADVFAHPAIGEPFGRAPAEAQAAGVPLVAFRSGAMEEVVADGETGLVCDLDAESFASALLALHDDPALRERMGKAAAERARKLFDSGRVVKEVLEVYEKLLAGTLPEPDPKPVITQKELRAMRRRRRRPE